MIGEQSLIRTIGVIGSIAGIAAGLASLLRPFATSALSVAAYTTEVGLWILWLVLQGSAFLFIYRERNDTAALAAFILAIISALIEALVLIVLFTVPSIIDLAESLVTILQFVFTILIGTFTEATYLIFSGIAVLHMTRFGAKESIAFGTGILFILTGCVVGLGFFVTLPLFIPIFVIVLNIIACILFISPMPTDSQQYGTEETDSGIEIL